MVKAAQAVLDAWEQDEDGWDEDLGSGGACDEIAEAISSVISSLDGVELTDGGHDGDDHAWVIAYDNEYAYGIDIHPSVYESGGGYSWTKREGVVLEDGDVSIEPLNRSDVVVASAARLVSSRNTR